MTAPALTAREAWLQDRRRAITGTDVAKICGLSEWGGPMSVYLEKIGAEDEEKYVGYRESGNRFQEPILRWYADREDVPLDLADPFDLVRVPDFPLLGASLDARWAVKDRRPVDAKNIRWQRDGWGEEGSDVIPDDYSLQLAVQMEATSTEAAELAVLFSGQDLVVYRVHRDPEVAAMVREVADHFWKTYVEPQTPPPVDGSESWTEYLRRRVKQTSELISRVDVDELEVHKAMRAYREIETQIGLLVMQRNAAENVIKARIGEGAGIEGPWGRVTWRKCKDTMGTKWEELARYMLDDLLDPEEREELLRQFHGVVKHGSRRFLPRLTAEGAR